MIDRNLLLTDFDSTAEKLARKGVARTELEQLRDLLEQRKKLVHEVGQMRAQLNKASKQIGELMKGGDKEAANTQREAVASLKSRISDSEEQVRQVEADADHVLLRTPNLPADDAPVGDSEEDNVVLRVHGYDEADYQGRHVPPHWEIAEALGIMDSERAAKISGQMFSLLRGAGAQLLHALVQFGLDLNRDTYEQIQPPHFVRTDTFTATGHLPKFEQDAYRLRDDDLWAIPTGEVPLMSLHRDEILDLQELPKRYMAYTVCFRREAGAAGKDTRGLQRLHEFHKVELLKLCTPETSQQEFELMLADAERALQVLGLPYRVVDLCTQDLTFSSARIHDLEVYSPGVGRWLEVSSCGIFTDFQARRANIRFRNAEGKTELVHALNGSGMATPRIWLAVIEHGYQEDGSVKLPEPLVKYMGTDVIRPR